MRRVITATEARIHFGEVMRRTVEERTPTIVERDGKPQVVILAVSEYERLLEGQPPPQPWRELVRRAREAIAADLKGKPVPSVDDLIRQMREERDAELLDLR